MDERTKRQWTVSALMFVALNIGISAAYADYFIYGEGKKQPFCEAILKALNTSLYAMKRKPNTYPCVSEVVLSMPGVSDPPWEKLDLDQHEALAKEILMYYYAGPYTYFRKGENDPKRWPTAAQLARRWNHAKQMGAELFALRRPDYGDKVRVTLRYKNDICGREIRPRGEIAETVWASPDLTRIVNDYPNELPHRPLLYRGQIYYANLAPDTGPEIDVRSQYGNETHMCNIEFSDSANSKGQPK